MNGSNIKEKWFFCERNEKLRGPHKKTWVWAERVSQSVSAASRDCWAVAEAESWEKLLWGLEVRKILEEKGLCFVKKEEDENERGLREEEAWSAMDNMMKMDASDWNW